MSRRPLLSVVVSTPDTFESIRAVVGHLRAQSIRDQLELVLVCPDPEALAAAAATGSTTSARARS